MTKSYWISIIIIMLFLLHPLTGSANPVLSEKNGEILYLEETSRVAFTFLGQSTAEEYDAVVTVHLSDGSESPKLDISWTDVGTVEVENDMSGPVYYTRFAKFWICPEAGKYTFEMILHVDGGNEIIESTMVESTIVCQSAGDSSNVSFDGIEFDSDTRLDTDSDVAVDGDSDSSISTDSQENTNDKDSADTNFEQDPTVDESSSDTGCNISFMTKSNSLLLLLQYLF